MRWSDRSRPQSRNEGSSPLSRQAHVAGYSASAAAVAVALGDLPSKPFSSPFSCDGTQTVAPSTLQYEHLRRLFLLTEACNSSNTQLLTRSHNRPADQSPDQKLASYPRKRDTSAFATNPPEKRSLDIPSRSPRTSLLSSFGEDAIPF